MYTAVWDLALLLSYGDDCHFSNKLFLFFYYEISCDIIFHFICIICNTTYVILFGSIEREYSAAEEFANRDVRILPISYTFHSHDFHILSNPVPFKCSGSMLLFLMILGELAVLASSDDRVSLYCHFLCIKIDGDN
jgi:hypothetical protein